MHLRLSALGLALVAVLALAAAGPAATPSGGTVGPTASVSWQGQSYAATSIADPTLCPPAALDPSNAVCDHFKLTVDVAPSYWDTHVGGASVTLAWASNSNDFDLYIYDANGNEVVRSAQGGTTSEQATIGAASGTHDVVVVPFLVVNSGYSGTASFVSQAPTAVPGGGPQAYNGVRVSGPNPDVAPQSTPAKYKGPSLLLQNVDVGREAAEPTIGVDKTGTAFYAAATFEGLLGTAHTIELRSKDAGLTWQSVQPTIAGQLDAQPETLDPYTYVEETSGRVFDIDLAGVGSELSFSDDQGASWTTTVLTVPGVNDHHTLFAGPTPVGNPALKPLDPRFPKILYYCVNQVSDSACAHSLDGGLTFSPTGAPAYTGVDPAAGGV